MPRFRPFLPLAAVVLGVSPLLAQGTSRTPSTADASQLTVERIYGSREFSAERFGPTRWMPDGGAYTTLERATEGRGREIVRYDAASGRREVLVTAAELTPAGDSLPLEVEAYTWSPNLDRMLIYTNSERVWRQNTRGDYWLLTRGATPDLRKLGGEGPPSTMMFAKFSPDGGRVGYVREHDLYVEDLATGRITRLTTDGSRIVINGTFDWVYEEELGLRDGWRWSPDGRHIAYWQLVADSVRTFPMINTTDSLYAFVQPVQYPKVGESNSAARIGVIATDSVGTTRWLDIPGDPRNHYLARMFWTPDSRGIVIEQLNRKQNTMILLAANPGTGRVRPVATEQDRAWVDVVDDFRWLDDGRRFLWTSERDGWNHAWVVDLRTREPIRVTNGAFDVLNIVGVDEGERWLYYTASPGAPGERYLYRSRLSGGGEPERVTPEGEVGWHDYDAGPGLRYAIHTHSAFGVPPTTDLVRIDGHRRERVLVANDSLKAAVARLAVGPSEFRMVPGAEGDSLNAWIMKPPGFDPSREYPVLFFVYGGPGSQTVQNRWGGSTWLWHLMLTQRGVAVASVDNRGTGARGRDFRKAVYGQLGVLESADQGAAARALATEPWVDRDHLGIWGWSYGGFMTLNALFRHPDTYAMGMAVAPVTHWKYYDNIYTERYNGLISENAAGYDAGSPLTVADSLQGELLVVHGTGDDNVHYQNTEALVNALVAANKQFEMMGYPNRNHGIFGGNTTLHLRTLLTRYALEHLTGNPDGNAARPLP